jgi:CubicO group peptidase (beta-lactamase class C family)
MRAFFAFCRVLLPLILVFGVAPAAEQSPVAAKINAVLERYAADLSGVVLVAERGVPVFERAYGLRNVALAKPIAPDSIFELASLSKQFTAMSLMILKEQGKLDYDDALEKYIPGLPYPGITIRHLLTHTSGLPHYEKIMDAHWDKTKIAHNADIIAAYKKYKAERKFAPGEKYEYCNGGYVLIASIVEKLSGQDFGAFVRDHVFKRLGMIDTDIRSPADWDRMERFALGYARDKKSGKLVRASSLPGASYLAYLAGRYGPGRVSSTVGDLLKWDRVLYTEKLLPKAAMEEAYKPMRLNNGTLSQYGMGWMLDSDPQLGRIVHHTGHNPGYANHIIRMIDKDLTIIILTNRDFEPLDALSKDLIAAFAGK